MGIVEFDVERLREVAIKLSDERKIMQINKIEVVLICNTALKKH